MRIITKADLSGKKVLIRVGLNVPLEDGNVTDDLRLRASVPTIKHCLKTASQVIVCGHVGRPKGRDETFSVKPVMIRLEELLHEKFTLVDDFTKEAIPQHAPLVMLENIRFYDEEKKNDDAFAKKLADIADIFVIDAFADIHRKHASTYGVAAHIPSYAGLSLQKEVAMLERVLSPAHPFVGVLGFAKISDKLQLLELLLEKVDRVVLGGAVIFTFFKAAGLEVGTSLVEDDLIPTVTKLMRKYQTKIQLPTDVVVASGFDDKNPEVVPYHKMPVDKMGLDIGPQSVEAFRNTLLQAKTVFWNGPLGVFEHPPYDKATVDIAHYLAEQNLFCVVGGGDTASAARHAGVVENLSHVSTGGGATLAFISGEELPGLECLGYYS